MCICIHIYKPIKPTRIPVCKDISMYMHIAVYICIYIFIKMPAHVNTHPSALPHARTQTTATLHTCIPVEC